MAKTNPNYKFLDLKTYGSTEILANNTRDYCQVFEKMKSSYIYCEFSFINKKFEIEDWKIDLNIKCLNEQNEELCNFDCSQIIDPDKHTVFIREGWGTQSQDTFWNIGTYRWEVFIENELIASKNFYVLSCGNLVSETHNPYFDTPAIRFYEGPDGNIDSVFRKYKHRFNYSTARYIWVELHAQNNYLKDEPWPCELTMNFRNSNGLLKGTLNTLTMVKPGENNINVNSGWGSNKLGTWAIGQYQVDFIFMNVIIAQKHFVIDSKHESPTLISRLKYLFLGKP